MEHISPLQCMSQYMQLGNDINVLKEKLAEQSEIYLQVLDALLVGQNAISGAEAAVWNSRNSLHLAIQLLQQANQQHQATSGHLETLSGNVDSLKTGLTNLQQSMNSQEMRVADLILQRGQLADRVRFVDVEIQSVEDVDLVLSVHKEMDWYGSVYLAEGLERAQRDVLTEYVRSTELEDVFGD